MCQFVFLAGQQFVTCNSEVCLPIAGLRLTAMTQCATHTLPLGTALLSEKSLRPGCNLPVTFIRNLVRSILSPNMHRLNSSILNLLQCFSAAAADCHQGPTATSHTQRGESQADGHNFTGGVATPLAAPRPRRGRRRTRTGVTSRQTDAAQSAGAAAAPQQAPHPRPGSAVRGGSPRSSGRHPPLRNLQRQPPPASP